MAPAMISPCVRRLSTRASDQTFPELVEIHDPADEDHERHQVEEDERRVRLEEDRIAEQAPDQRKGMRPSPLPAQRRCPSFRFFDIALQDFYKSPAPATRTFASARVACRIRRSRDALRSRRYCASASKGGTGGSAPGHE